MSTLIDAFDEDPTMRKRAEFESELFCLIASLRQKPSAPKKQLVKDSEALLEKWIELTNQGFRKTEINERIEYSVRSRSFKYEKWIPAGK
jgi:hypothetical protein